ncbi:MULTISPECIES: nicotinate (nicotinamide) nucleotide adenylyltransferase [unclassified Bacillus (in: firmicutes)]|uniref:nicotinate (nicotinamide) nucleotide adenylyltransferase n=1 Tax=unclassified Bacillus (in: firmicutes) TaxID=185979 RepID=UPI0008E30396|nr:MULTISPECIES: nicotinate (nicotinamide) nucleotide adenylyltransferase [unclassified Bacillus (in: firmicutes)]SFB11689.1 nicotinate-nucleotide adenylyltransferase [Bacillus sp. UNCCL13]SFQ90466.1 nicotinate-nucleotide adenylyltransferase [Bacillus sp. cl95]
MAKIGIYGSSFDPITNVHLWTASTIAHRCRLDKVIFLPCSNKRKDKKMKTEDIHRWNMLQMAIEKDERFAADSFEMEQEAWKIFTYNTMEHFKKRYPNDEVYFIMGADLLVDIGAGMWKNGEELVAENKFIVMARDGIDMLSTISRSPILRNHDNGSRFHLIDKGLAMEISSSYIREEFAMGGEPKFLLPQACYDYIKEHGLYLK